MRELDEQVKIADFMRYHYPTVVFHADYGSGLHMTMNQAKIQKRLNGGWRGWPDIFIAHEGADGQHGLFIELKKEGTKLICGDRAKNRFKSIDGCDYKTEHLMEQADMLETLRSHGYLAMFAIGYKEAIQIIDEYLGG